jgi:ribosomal protein L7/L12
MNNTGTIASVFAKSLVITLANILLAQDGTDDRVRDVASARRLLVDVFTSPSSGSALKIACIKFVRTNTDMGLKEAKEFVEDYVFIGNPVNQPLSRIRRMQDRQGVTNRH